MRAKQIHLLYSKFPIKKLQKNAHKNMLVYVCFKYFSQLLLLKFHRRSELNTFTWEKPFESNNSLLKKEKTISSNLKSSKFDLV